MCGIIGCIAQRFVNQDIFDALTILQHRGQDAAGIMTCDGERVYLRKENGLVRDVIRQSHMLTLVGKTGIGHVRYPTAGSNHCEESQPFFVNSPYGLGIVHNGNLVNTDELKQDIIRADLRHLNTRSDSEILLNVFAHELQKQEGHTLLASHLFKALSGVHARVRGAYAAIVMIVGHGLFAFRDPLGIRPLVYGVRETAQGNDYMFASESIALDALGYRYCADVQPGEGVYINPEGDIHRQVCAEGATLSPCLFEYIYLARPDSIIDGICVHEARMLMGKKLADKMLALCPNPDVDVVIPIPDTSRTAALALAQRLKIPFCEGFVKNRYIGRTFIMPGHAIRRSSVRLKLNAIKQEFLNKNVLLVDDSIVRGTTSKEIIQMARDAGAKKVYFASAAPEVRFPNVYGIDMPCVSELIAHGRSVQEIQKAIGADFLIYQNLEDVKAAVCESSKDPLPARFEDSIFTGRYPTGIVDAAYLAKLARARAGT